MGSTRRRATRRSRSTGAAKEIKKDKWEELFAATPPREAKKVLISLSASTSEMCSDFTDMLRAYLHAKARRMRT